MKRIALLHLLWLTVAIGAFVVGRVSVTESETRASGAANLTARGLALQGGDGQAPAGPTSTESLVRKPSKEAAAEARLVGPLSQSDIEAIAKEAFSDPNPLKREIAFAKLLDGLTAENAEQIREQMRGGRANGDQWRLFQYAWGSVDGVGALAAAQEIERDDWRQGAISQALSGFASEDPRAAIEWLNGMEAEERGRYQDELVSGLADGDLSVARDYVLGLVESGDRRAPEMMGIVAGEQLRKDGPVAAAAWAERLPDGAAKGAAMDRVANAYVARDPVAAAEWAEKYATADFGARVIEEVGDEWAERDPVAAVNWLETIEDGRGKMEAYQSAMGEWVRKDPTAASEYLVNMPASDLKDRAVNGFVGRLAWEDPQSAIAWAETIQQDALRVEALTDVGRAYFRRDREGATEWLASSGLPEEAQQRVLESRDRRRGRG